jgi:mannonate dehydratase
MLMPISRRQFCAAVGAGLSVANANLFADERKPKLPRVIAYSIFGLTGCPFLLSRPQAMRLATVLTPESDENLALAAQCGVTDIVTRYCGRELDPLVSKQQRFHRFGLKLTAIEGFLPIENIKLGLDDGRELNLIEKLIGNMGRAGIPILCYNFMAGTDWVRTRLDAPQRGGALVTAFDLNDAERFVSLNHREPHQDIQIDADSLWRNLEEFLRAVIPVAESANVTLTMHPDDPPLEEFLGKSRIMNSVEGFH